MDWGKSMFRHLINLSEEELNELHKKQSHKNFVDASHKAKIEFILWNKSFDVSRPEKCKYLLAKRKATQLSRKLLKELPNNEDLTNQKSKI